MELPFENDPEIEALEAEFDAIAEAEWKNDHAWAEDKN